MNDAIISLKPKHISNIINGKKTVELRNRTVNINPGTRLWLYSTLPDGYIGALALVDSVEVKPPNQIWQKFGKEIAITKIEFNEYTYGKKLVSAIKIQNIYTIEPGIGLDCIRKRHEGFHPPQFMKWLQDDRLLRYLNMFVEKKTTSISLAW